MNTAPRLITHTNIKEQKGRQTDTLVLVIHCLCLSLSFSLFLQVYNVKRILYLRCRTASLSFRWLCAFCWNVQPDLCYLLLSGSQLQWKAPDPSLQFLSLSSGPGRVAQFPVPSDCCSSVVLEGHNFLSHAHVWEWERESEKKRERKRESPPPRTEPAPCDNTQ